MTRGAIFELFRTFGEEHFPFIFPFFSSWYLQNVEIETVLFAFGTMRCATNSATVHYAAILSV